MNTRSKPAMNIVAGSIQQKVSPVAKQLREVSDDLMVVQRKLLQFAVDSDDIGARAVFLNHADNLTREIFSLQSSWEKTSLPNNEPPF
jgi:hypothetical protein